jgi:hypothetical protein
VPAESDQARRTAKVLTLLDEAWQLWSAGDHLGSTRVAMQAQTVDSLVVMAVRTGTILGEIPNPDVDSPPSAGNVESARERAEDHAAGEPSV